MAVDYPSHHKKQIREPIEVGSELWGHGFAGSQRYHGAFGTAADGAREVSERGATGPARQYEFLEWFERLIESVERSFQTRGVCGCHYAVAGNAEFAAEVKQVVLNAGQALAHRLGQIFAQQQANHAIEFVHLSDRFHARRRLGNPATVREPGEALVAGSGIDLGEPICHGARELSNVTLNADGTQ